MGNAPLGLRAENNPIQRTQCLEEHVEYMWKNKHLKAIPKAKVDENGREIIEVGSHRRGIVEELEKAHIYIEQIHKQNKELYQQNKELHQHIKALEERLAKLEAGLNARQ